MRKIIFALAALAFETFFSPALFADITLRSADDALQIAMANDKEFKVRRQYAEEEVRLAKRSLAPFLPEFDFAISDSAYAKKTDGDYKKKSIEAGVTQKIFNGGKSLLEYKMQKEKSLYNFLEVQEEEKARRNKIVQGYYDALLAKLKADVMAGALENAGDVLLIAQIEEAQGMISKTDFLESQIRFGQIKAQEKNARAEFMDLCRSLNELMGLDARVSLCFGHDAEGELMERAALEKDLNARLLEFSTKAAQSSVELKKARARAEWEKRLRSLQARSFLPSVSVRAGFSFDGRDYPLTEPSYSFKVILGFDNNPWLPASVSRSAGVQKGNLVSVADSISARGIINTSWTSQMKLQKIGVEKSRLDAEKVRREIESKVFRLVQSVESARQNALLSLKTTRLKEQKLMLLKIQLEQGSVTKTNYLENLSECAAQKIDCLQSAVEAAALEKELEDLTSCKI